MCIFHKWSKWTTHSVTIQYVVHGKRVAVPTTIQKKVCSKCNKEKVREIL